jgi:hypothetical protein
MTHRVAGTTRRFRRFTRSVQSGDSSLQFYRFAVPLSLQMAEEWVIEMKSPTNKKARKTCMAADLAGLAGYG